MDLIFVSVSCNLEVRFFYAFTLLMGLSSLSGRCHDNDGYRSETCQSSNGSALSLCDHALIGPCFHPPRIEIIRFRQRILRSPSLEWERKNSKVRLPCHYQIPEEDLNRRFQVQSFSNNSFLHLLVFEIVFKSIVIF
jgi:hypothetical protein